MVSDKRPSPKYNLDSPTAHKSQASAASLRSREGSAPPPSATAAAPQQQAHVVPGNNESGITGGGNVRVVVRVRGVNQREADRGATCLISMDSITQATTLHAPPEGSRPSSARKIIEEKTFTFDNSFWSANPSDKHYADQEDIYNALGEEFLDHNFEGYHTCIFAYGQTGSGKSYSMMGIDGNPGLIPRTCEDLFERIESNTSPNVSYNVRVSYFEVYNEQVRDLLVPRREPAHYLKVRESPTDGPYVKDLTELPVKSFAEVMKYMTLGDMSRTIASTKMNDTSSRSHAVFTLTLKQIYHDMETDETTERTARIRLVDLAGSERANATGATGVRLREGSNINKSLTTLGRVIAALAGTSNPSNRKKEVVPYRDSILTWLLKDSLGGNSKTAMIACISPTDYDETLSTLRYASTAKQIRTRAVVNQDHVSAAERDQQIEEMQETIRALQLSVNQYSAAAGEAKKHRERDDLRNIQLEEYQSQVEKMQRLMEETRQVAECKIKSLQTQNEALRLHLKLAVESLKNPIPAVRQTQTDAAAAAAPVNDNPSTPKRSQPGQSSEANKENIDSDNNTTNVPTDPTDSGIAGSISLAGDFWTDSNWTDMDREVESRVDLMLKDLAMFRRKCADDKTRYMLSALREVSVNH